MKLFPLNVHSKCYTPANIQSIVPPKGGWVEIAYSQGIASICTGPYGKNHIPTWLKRSVDGLSGCVVEE